MKIYHNPSCSKSCTALDMLKASGVALEEIHYLDEIPSAEELSDIIKNLGVSAVDLVRKGEEVFLEKYEGKDLSDKEWIQAMVDHPILIQRPIVVKGDQAVMGRPPENVLKLL